MASITLSVAITFGRSVRIRSDNQLVKGCRLFAKSELTPSRVPWLRRSLAVRSGTNREAINNRDRSPAIDRLRRVLQTVWQEQQHRHYQPFGSWASVTISGAIDYRSPGPDSASSIGTELPHASHWATRSPIVRSVRSFEVVTHSYAH